MKANNFDLVAPIYDWLAALVYGNRVNEASSYFISKIDHAEEVLVVGGGTGAILKTIYRCHPKASITFLEPSTKMIHRAKKRRVPDVYYVEQTLEAFVSQHKFDLIVTPFVLDVYDEHQLNDAMSKIANLLKVGGNWLHSDFYEGERLWWQKLLIQAMYRFFGLIAGLQNQKLPNFDSHFEKTSGISAVASRVWLRGLIKAVWMKKEQPL